MEFSNSILPKEGSYYTLQDATISGGILSISPGGSARYEIVETDIVNLTEYFRVVLMLDKIVDRYEPDIKVSLYLRTSDDKYYNAEVYPTYVSNNVFIQDIQLQEGTYKSFVFEITSRQAVNISLWELCPQASESDVEVIIEGVKQSLPRLLFDYNMWPLSVGQDEKTIAMIAYRLIDHTDLQAHFQLAYISEKACTLTLRFKDNGTTELFCPITYDIKPGRGSVSVPHAYLERLAGIHTATVSAQVTDGSLSIGTRSILFTIDGGYLAERLIDVGVDIRDISIRQLSMDNGPDEIWIIGIDAGEALVRSRKYDLNASITMEPQFSLGRAIDAAIEFDGDWILRHKQENYTLETQEKPWCFWIDTESTLHAQIGDLTDTHVIIDTDVTSLSVCRGYKSSEYLVQDQGLICAYIKNEQAYYKQYRYIGSTQKVAWDVANTVDSTLVNVTHISVSRLNDFRVQISVKCSEGVKTYISDRTYVTQAVKPELLALNSQVYRSLFNLDPTLTDASGTVSDIETSDGTDTIEITYLAQVKDYLEGSSYDGLERLRDTAKVTCDRLENVYIKKVKIADNKLILTLDQFVQGIVTINIPADNYLYITNSSTKQGLFIAQQTLAVNVMSVYRVYAPEMSLLQATLTGKAEYKSLSTFNAETSEELSLSSTVTTNSCTVSDVTNVPIDNNEDVAALSCNLTGTLTVTPVGTSPI